MKAPKGRKSGHEPGTAAPSGVRPVTDATVALRIRRRREQKRNLVTALMGIGAVALIAAIVWGLAFSSVFSVSKVDTSGTKILTPAQITQLAAVPNGRPLVRVDLDAIAKRIAANPAVESVTVKRNYPSTITIEITERTIALQRKHGSSHQWIDRHGIVFHQTAQADKTAALVQVPTLDQRLLQDLAVVAAALSPELKKRLVAIAATTPDTITLLLDKGQKVVWGSAADSETKSQVATALLAIKATVFDVSSPGTPTTR